MKKNRGVARLGAIAATGALMLGGATAGNAAPTDGVRVMAAGLLKCLVQEDYTGSDSPYLLRNGVKIWGPESMSAGGSKSMSLAVSSGDRLTLMEDDWPDGDDDLGSLTVVGTGPYNFTGDGAHYILNIVGW